MIIKCTPIPTDSLANKYLPANYSDVFACEVAGNTSPSPDDIIISFFTDMPAWVKALFRLRNFMVQFVGLKGSNERTEELKDCIRTGGKSGFISVPDKNNHETVLLLEDKHLNAYLSVHIANTDNNKKNVSLITVVHFNNRLGNVYFAIIQPFHKIVVKSMLKRALSKQT
ncbi:hypothetical protein M2459_003675 [Parabacteroides sp. PF5-5]|uniref:DUF2867 domain-containing protein n=1 Tax=unclassified Parabacteroides TaxID=2649774 RepID=UPI00247640C8|nr:MULTISPECIES: DUF2867 domain-containing protein [unclassified Parabacteroides]MDH6307000.1 hypothetical protein [Parabacteroides sp. PH5-39]MDH6317868.1 hypothetical protein [Parabacteroides sp. PF5-13]MDH6321630.1 hypothetical protein [Parabacteroides sp. PH5-13]MDH6325387.1 hypothetical protein [Parabacteroides sp. PH5-8]MDH6329103.1 hypothetical protein [Parabacteroides sp. PH5-41]